MVIFIPQIESYLAVFHRLLTDPPGDNTTPPPSTHSPTGAGRAPFSPSSRSWSDTPLSPPSHWQYKTQEAEAIGQDDLPSAPTSSETSSAATPPTVPSTPHSLDRTSGQTEAPSREGGLARRRDRRRSSRHSQSRRIGRACFGRLGSCLANNNICIRPSLR